MSTRVFLDPPPDPDDARTGTDASKAALDEWLSMLLKGGRQGT
jgi:hypothetical protein